ncbi:MULTISPECIES: GlsB/YeaQ/YmgE family stress response membrane protein [unclassified Roseitalea]|uniref:GlsB/YeaQ/YmgE family stress response membrane protein n=1 Tax=unclassified Roseitalea TaxID=2639107 RepID=UPI00320A4FFC
MIEAPPARTDRDPKNRPSRHGTRTERMLQRFAIVLPALLLPASAALAQDEAAQAVGAAVGGIIGLLLLIIIGAIVGWLAGLIVKGHGSGLFGNIAAGIGGSILAGYVLPLLGIPIGGALGSFIAALIGAVVLILVVGLIRKAAN